MSVDNIRPSKPQSKSQQDEHYLRAGTGTQTACSCGKSFGLADDARQHIEWQLRSQSYIDKAVVEARKEEIERLIFTIDNTRKSMELPDDETSAMALKLRLIQIKGGDTT